MDTSPRPEPLAVPLARAPAVLGISRSSIYRAAANGQLRLLKRGRTTLVCMNSIRAFLAALPLLSPRQGGHRDP